MVEGARLESVCTLIAYRGFESLPLRHISMETGLSSLCFNLYTILHANQESLEAIFHGRSLPA